ncbi:MAG: galactosyltransferase-related protein [Nocardioidaceae bacterium]
MRPGDPATVAVTVVRGRHDHLRRQHQFWARSERVPDRLVVVSMGDPAVARVVAAGPLAERTQVVELGAGARLPLARARNLGVAAAVEAGAGLVVLLDVDCLPSSQLLTRYQAAHRGRPDALLCGPVCYLDPPSGPDGWTADELAAAPPHPARPSPPAGTVLVARDTRLFWSLSFAVSPGTWSRVGGFDEAYEGYGGEDTDFGQRADAAGVPMCWVGGAVAHHQWHPVSRPPVEHLEDIVRNANLFHLRWGWFPMEGWLTAFADRGLARLVAGEWRVR